MVASEARRSTIARDSLLGSPSPWPPACCASASTASRRTSRLGMRSGELHESGAAAARFRSRRSRRRLPRRSRDPGRPGTSSAVRPLFHAGRTSPRVSIASRRISTSGWLCARSSRALFRACLRSRRAFPRPRAGCRGPCPAWRSTSGPRPPPARARAQRLDGLTTRVGIGQRPRQRDQRRSRFGKREIAERLSGLLADV